MARFTARRMAQNYLAIYRNLVLQQADGPAALLAAAD
jgi:hypothetical protein